MTMGFGVGIQRLGSFGVSTLAALTALPAPAEGVRPTGFVYADPTAANNGVYTWTGSVWQRQRGLGDQVAVLTVSGGTANAITAQPQAGIDLTNVIAAIIIPTAANTGAVTLNGKAVRDAEGNALTAGAFAAGRAYFLWNRANEYRTVVNELGVISDIAGLQAALNSKADLALLDDKADNSDLDALSAAIGTALNGKANSVHTHSIANVTGLQTALDLKAATSSVVSVVEFQRMIARIAIEVADLKGASIKGIGLIADAFDDATGVQQQTGGNDINTVTLLHFDGANNSTAIVDACSSPRKYSAVGDAKILTNQSKFGGSSVYFDGAGDYVIGDGNPAYVFTSDYTIDFWVCPNSGAAVNRYVVDMTGGSGNNHVGMYISTTGVMCASYNGSTMLTGTTGLAVGVWYHIALVRTAGTTKMYVNGVQEGGNTAAANGNLTPGTTAPTLGINGSSNPYLGWIDEFRVSNVARWTSGFTPPTAQYANDNTKSQNVVYSEANDWFTPTTELGNTNCLIHADGANGSTAIVDATGLRSWTVVGSPIISNTRSKFGGTSLYFAGSGYVRSVPIAPYADLAFRLGDYTVDCWVNFTSVASVPFIWDARSSGATSLPILYVSAAKFTLNTNASDRIVSTTTVAVDTWYHVAVVRLNGITRLYVNGVQEGISYTDATDWQAQSSGFTLANAYDASRPTNVYIDEFRISGVARWNANFTPPTTAYAPPVSNMTLRSVNYSAPSVPATMYIAAQTIETDAASINTDLILEGSRDGGTTWTAAVAALEDTTGGVKTSGGVVDLSAQPSGSTVAWRVRTANNKNIAISGVVAEPRAA